MIALNGIQEVVGSIPSSSTKNFKGLQVLACRPFFVEYTNEIVGILRITRLSFSIDYPP